MTLPTRSWLLTLSTALLCLPLLAANCPTQPDDDDDDDNGNAQAMHRLWDSYCDLLTRCESQWGKSFESKAACVAAWDAMTSCELEGIDFVDADTYDAAAGEACIAWLDAATCDTNVWGEEEPEGCAGVFETGGQRLGQSCEGQDQYCASDLYCDESETEGVCAVCQQRPGLDQSCSDYPYVPCGDGLFCDDSTSTCKAALADSTACSEDYQCQSGYCRANACAAPLARDAACTTDDRCAGMLICRGGVCTDRVGTNETCSDTEECYLLTHACYQGSCRPVTICQLAPVGEFCGFGCVETAYCDYETGTCKAFTALGQPCSGWSECGPDAYCPYTSNVCTAYAGLGDPCSSGMCNEQTFCDYDAATPVCIAPRANGQDCNYGMECASGYCDESTWQCAAEPTCTMP